MPMLQRGELRRIRPGRALLLSEHTRPIRLRLRRCIAGRDGKRLRAEAAGIARRVETARTRATLASDSMGEAVEWSATNGLAARRSSR
jgi:type IV secretion system protein VirD4